MAVEDKQKKDESIKKEERRLKRIYSGIEINRKNTIAGLIQRAAFMRISLEELEEDLNVYGFTEWFSQGDQDPYLRERPTARIYNSMNTSYQKIVKQLTDLLPKEEPLPKGGDAFDSF